MIGVREMPPAEMATFRVEHLERRGEALVAMPDRAERDQAIRRHVDRPRGSVSKYIQVEASIALRLSVIDEGNDVGPKRVKGNSPLIAEQPGLLHPVGKLEPINFPALRRRLR